jgi:outer membrane protein assembly factor BamB
MLKNSSLFLLTLVLLVSAVPAADWPRWRGVHGTGISDEKDWDPLTLAEGARILWQTNVGNGYSAVSVQGRRAYTMGNTDDMDVVFCLDAVTGREIWRFAYACAVRNYPGSFATPVLDDGRVYTISRNGDVHCLDAGTGKKIWSVQIVDQLGAIRPKYGFSGSPVVEGRYLVLNACRHGIALDKQSGAPLWVSEPYKAGYATPVVYQDGERRCVAVFSHRRLYGVDLATGKALWHFPWEFPDGADSADPVVVGRRVFISTAYRNGATMIDFTDNQPRQCWFDKDIQNEFGSSIYKDGYLYVPTGDTRHRTAYLKCIDFETGDEKWCLDTGHCSIIHVDGKFIVLNQWGKLSIMEASEKGHRILSSSVVVETSGRVRCWTAPVLANGRIYVRTNTGDLVCVDVARARP